MSGLMKKSEIVLFETNDKEIKLSVPIEQETVWLTKAQMTELFERDVSVRCGYDMQIIENSNRISSEAEIYKNY